MSIIVYTKKGCPWSRKVFELFAEKGMKVGTDYEIRDVLDNKVYLDELIAKSNQSKSPTLDIDGEILADTDRDQVAAFLKAKGYPGF